MFLGTSISCRAFRKSAPVILLFFALRIFVEGKSFALTVNSVRRKSTRLGRLLVATPWRCDARMPSRRVGACWIAVINT